MGIRISSRKARPKHMRHAAHHFDGGLIQHFPFVVSPGGALLLRCTDGEREFQVAIDAAEVARLRNYFSEIDNAREKARAVKCGMLKACRGWQA
jgi:hypothetical protein